jgi:hypothetical protein
MKAIIPVTITDSTLTYSSIVENDYTEWAAATSYTAGDKVIRLTTHRIYESITGGVDATLPENATGGATPKWLDYAPTNRWAMFDQEIGSYSTATNEIALTLSVGAINAISFVDFTAAAIRVTQKSGGATVYEGFFDDFDSAAFSDIYDFFILDYEQIKVFSITDLSDAYFTSELNVIFYGASVSVGALIIGASKELGSAEYGANVGIIDYSRKDTNAFGRVEITPRRYVSTVEAKLVIDSGATASTYKTLALLRTTPCVWLLVENSEYTEITTIYGFYKDFSIDIAYPSVTFCTLTIEGLI